ncbi:unnamed protein product [Fusarium graminearum]|uniref:Chromosome 4, complete genome n=1 Tax=Gibberella zeae (strain ATCC MYA-4620 / CBS 123657 / FGSC 9075 / NRRL 31084 / PH-1) TaxID=229533 RepID=I1RYK2_GIBZE|nr:hypothetical protein FGSG_09458 [Fusarium graminearum PH-1]ESU16048.1 hypothetical protein FGSG_09458 [Fusarium graminearum PH-1]CEF84757.1 unnamed protein product [Fusarium graminearum]CZS74430.1 unnamed protein product [Fusarium graminearum]|eukprot:XP_011328268.1 hypothetical protein FGSG_09458 [Fusarium graminearum PH-1]
MYILITQENVEHFSPLNRYLTTGSPETECYHVIGHEQLHSLSLERRQAEKAYFGQKVVQVTGSWPLFLCRFVLGSYITVAAILILRAHVRSLGIPFDSGTLVQHAIVIRR